MAINTGSHVLLIPRQNSLDALKTACVDLLGLDITGTIHPVVEHIKHGLDSIGYHEIGKLAFKDHNNAPHLWAYDIEAIPFRLLIEPLSRPTCDEREAALKAWRKKWDSVALSEGWRILRQDGALVVDFFFDRSTHAKHRRIPLESIGNPQSGWNNFHRANNLAAQAAKEFILPMREGLAVLTKMYLNQSESSEQLFNVCAVLNGIAPILEAK
jgi:hypothetical protein